MKMLSWLLTWDSAMTVLLPWRIFAVLAVHGFCHQGSAADAGLSESRSAATIRNTAKLKKSERKSPVSDATGGGGARSLTHGEIQVPGRAYHAREP